AIQNSSELRAALGPRSSSPSPPTSPREAQRLSAVQAARGAAIAKRIEEERLEANAPSEGDAAATISAAARRAMAERVLAAQRGAAGRIGGAVRCGEARRRVAELGEERTHAADVLTAACRRAPAAAALRGMVGAAREASRAAAVALQAAVRAMPLRAERARAAAAEHDARAAGGGVVAAAVGRVASTAAWRAQRAAGCVLVAAAARVVVEGRRGAEEVAGGVLRARVRSKLAMEALLLLQGAGVVQRCSVLERRRNVKGRQPSWKKLEARNEGGGADSNGAS
ncbi:hypothetical protein T484DRAFT_1791184, partial [Baffinella frigidus]